MRKLGNRAAAAATATISGNNGSTYRDLLDLSSAPWQPEFMEFQDGHEYRFDVIPYVVLSKKDPMVFARKLMPNDIALTLEIPAHRLGPTFAKVLCPKKYGKPCEACELRDQGYETVKAMNIPRVPKGQQNPAYTNAANQHIKPWKESMRSFCWVRPYEKRGTQWVPLTVPKIMEISSAFFSQALYTQLNNTASASSVDIGDVVSSYSVFVKAEKGKLGGVSLEALTLVPRTVAIPDEMENACFSISEYLVETTPAQIKELCYGAEPDNTPAQPAMSSMPTNYPPQAQEAPEQHKAVEYQGSSGPHAYAAQPTYAHVPPSQPAYQEPEAPSMGVDFGDVSGLEYGDRCPSGHRFARDLGKKPECTNCPYVADCTRVAEAD